MARSGDRSRSGPARTAGKASGRVVPPPEAEGGSAEDGGRVDAEDLSSDGEVADGDFLAAAGLHVRDDSAFDRVSGGALCMPENTSEEIGIRDLRAKLGDVVNDISVRGGVTYITSYGWRVAAIVPVTVAEALEAKHQAGATES